MRKKWSFSTIGIETPIELFGNVTILRSGESFHTLFLFDESHDNINDCIDKNIENARILLFSANITLVGVESLAGGKEWDEDDQKYVPDNSNEKYYAEYILKDWKNNCTRFCDELCKSNPQVVVGVESVGMMNKIEVDLYDNNSVDSIKAIKEHPLQVERSRHFISTLFDVFGSRSCCGNIILNCGSDHNNHIEEWIRNGEIDRIAGTKANYVRISTI
jgi:hypothetical protein